MDKKRIIKVAICSFISAIIWCTVSKCFASTDTMYTTFENMSKDSWLKITDYFYENTNDPTLKSKLKYFSSNGENSTDLYNSLITYIKGYNDKTNYGDVIFLLRYARSELNSLTFILKDNAIYIYTNDIYHYNGGTATDLSNYTKIEDVNYDLTLTSSNVYYQGSYSGNLKYHSTSNASNNYRYLYIRLGEGTYTITYGTGNASNLGTSLLINPSTLTQGLNENDNTNIFYYNNIYSNIVQFAASGAYGNPLISFYMLDYKTTENTKYPYLCGNAVYLDGSPSTGGGSGGDTGGDEGGGGGGDTGGTSVDLSNIENTLGNINTSIIETGQQTNQNLDEIKEAINQTNEFIIQEPTTSDDEFAESFPTVEIDDPSEDFFTWIFENIENIFLSTEEQVFEFNLYTDTVYTISTEQIKVTDSELKTLVGLSIDFGICYWILKDVRKTINKVKDGSIESLADEDITANMV